MGAGVRGERRDGVPIGVGVAGLGRIGTRHAENLVAGVTGARLAAVMDLDATRARLMGESYDVPWFDSLAGIIADRRVDALIVATPAPTHAGIVEEAVASVRGVLCEKPLAETVAEAARAAQVARAAGVVLHVGYQMRCDPDLADAAARIHAGEIGDVRHLRASLRDMAPPAPAYVATSGGLFLDGASHLLDLARWIGGPIQEVIAVAETGDGGEILQTVTVLRFDNGALGVLDNSRSCGYGFDCTVEVVGSRRTVRVGDNRRSRLEWRSPGTVSVDHTLDFLDRWRTAYRVELEAFVAAVAGGHAPPATGEDGAAATELALAAERSCREGRPVAIGAVAGRAC